MATKIKLSNNKGYALVDNGDFDYLQQWKWQLHTDGYGYRISYVQGRRLVFYMHQEVNKSHQGMVTYHINGNKLDNRRSNLRYADKSLNAISTGLRNVNKSGYKSGYIGVSWHKNNNKWQSYICKDNKQTYLGIYNKLSEAIEAREKAEKSESNRGTQ